MLEKPGIVARTGAAGVDQRRAAAAREYQRIDAQRSAAPVDVGVKIDQTGRDDATLDVADIGALQPLADFSHFAVAETDVARRVDALRRVDHASAS